jgi:SAM-dependent methyltransferase
VPPFPPEAEERERRSFHEGAFLSRAAFERGLASIGASWHDFNRALDFGCGPGRVLRVLGDIADSVELHGTDVDEDAITWCRQNIPYAGFSIAPDIPPTSYADGWFDLVFNHSVFTHFDEEMQDAWLAELRRVLAPGGIAMLSVHSAEQWEQAIHDIAGAGENADDYVAELASHGILFIKDDLYVGSVHPPYYHTTYHTPWYVFDHWQRFFRVRAYIPRGADTQDLVVCERTNDPVPKLPLPRSTADEAAPHGASPPRHASAQRELDMIRLSLHEHARRIARIEAELEDSRRRP